MIELGPGSGVLVEYYIINHVVPDFKDDTMMLVPLIDSLEIRLIYGLASIDVILTVSLHHLGEGITNSYAPRGC